MARLNVRSAQPRSPMPRAHRGAPHRPPPTPGLRSPILPLPPPITKRTHLLTHLPRPGDAILPSSLAFYETNPFSSSRPAAGRTAYGPRSTNGR